MSVPFDHKTRKQGTAKPVWSDGIHFVRPAAATDKHKLRWVVGAHKGTGSTLKRHVATKEAAIETAATYTGMFLKANPDASRFLKNRETPKTTEASPSIAVVLQPWSITLFDCVYANPVAQVWMMTRQPGERKPVGRRKANGQPPAQAIVHHEKGECAVTRGHEPIREDDGSVRIFHTQGEAEEYAEQLYFAEPQENTISWKHGFVRVAALEHVEVHFNPAVYGVTTPFVLWLPQHKRCVFVDRTRPTARREGIGLKAIEESKGTQLANEVKEARWRAKQEDRQPSFESRPLRFRSLAAAVEEAERRERMLRGEVVR